jgi:exonuclease III
MNISTPHTLSVMLQEHWLLPNELCILSSLHCDIVATAQSAVDIGQDVLIGRPYGGTAILFRKTLIGSISFIETNESRLTAVLLSASIGPVLVICVYMPTDYGTDESSENYISICSKIEALYAESDAVHMIVGGDFNCREGG